MTTESAKAVERAAQAIEDENDGLRPEAPGAVPAVPVAGIGITALTTAQILDFLANGTALPDIASTDAQRDIILRILDAEDPDELLAEQTFTHADEVQYRDLTIHATGWRLSTIEAGEGLPFYAVMDVSFDDGTREAVSCGGANVVGQLIRAEQRGWFPLRCQLQPAKKATAAGFFPLWLRPPLQKAAGTTGGGDERF